MYRMRACLFLLLLLALFLRSPLAAQQSEIRVTPGMVRITRPAGYIFAGTVRAIQFEPITASGQIPTVRVTFQVDEAIRGTRTGTSFTIREWAGLWNAGERYQRGQRVVLFLYPMSKLGLTSPVGASLGRFSVDQSGHVVMHNEQTGMIRSFQPRTPIRRGRIHLRDFTRAVRRGLREED